MNELDPDALDLLPTEELVLALERRSVSGVLAMAMKGMVRGEEATVTRWGPVTQAYGISHIAVDRIRADLLAR